MKTSPLQFIVKKIGGPTVVFLFTLLSTITTTNLVLCICHDGHVSLEANCNPTRCCPDDACSMEDGSSAILAAQAPGHPCMDFSFERALLGPIEARLEEALVLPLPEVPALAVVLTRLETTAPVRAFDRASTVLAPASDLCTRFVVLTI